MASESTRQKGKSSNNKASNPPPPIAEKVRFWQEQDRINKAMIPRLVQLADQVGHLSSRIDRFETAHNTAVWKYAKSLELRLAEQERQLVEIRMSQKEQVSLRRLQTLAWIATTTAILALFGVAYLMFRMVA